MYLKGGLVCPQLHNTVTLASLPRYTGSLNNLNYPIGPPLSSRQWGRPIPMAMPAVNMQLKFNPCEIHYATNCDHWPTRELSAGNSILWGMHKERIERVFIWELITANSRSGATKPYINSLNKISSLFFSQETNKWNSWESLSFPEL